MIYETLVTYTRGSRYHARIINLAYYFHDSRDSNKKSEPKVKIFFYRYYSMIIIFEIKRNTAC